MFSPAEMRTGRPATDDLDSSMTVQGGDQSFGWGTAFKLTPEGVETILHSFTAQSDGAYPSVGLVQGSDGNFYGTAGGGMNDGATIFRLTPTAG